MGNKKNNEKIRFRCRLSQDVFTYVDNYAILSGISFSDALEEIIINYHLSVLDKKKALIKIE